MAEFIKVTTVDKVPKGKKVKVEAKGVEIMLTNVDGKIYAIENICSHEECGLDECDWKALQSPVHVMERSMTYEQAMDSRRLLGVRARTLSK